MNQSRPFFFLTTTNPTTASNSRSIHRLATSATRTITTTTSIATNAFTILGVFYGGWLVQKVSRFIWRHYLRPSTNLVQRYNTHGWVVVTGATSGIGRSCVQLLAQMGFSIVMIARTKENLQSLQQQLHHDQNNSTKIETMIISIDASNITENDIDTYIVEKVKDKGVSFLINSVGIHNHRPMNVDEMEWNDTQRMIQVNCCFPILLTSKLIPLLKENAVTYGHAGIMNIGSLTSTTPFCMGSTYAATKSLLAHWSRCVAAELSPYNIDVLSVRPGLTATPMSDIDKPGGIVADATSIAKRALSMMGIPVKDVVPYPIHDMLDYLGQDIIPEQLQDSITRSMNLEKQREMDDGSIAKAGTVVREQTNKDT